MADAAIERYVIDDVNGVASVDGVNVVLDFVDPDGDGASTIALERRQLFGNAVDQILATEDVTETTSSADRVYWPMVDHLGTVRDLVENDGTLGEHYTYDSFGNVTSGDTSLIRYLYTSRELDTATGLQYNRARWYGASVGRWISMDPIGYRAGDTNLNRYVGNRSSDASDPSGYQEGAHYWNPPHPDYLKWKYDKQTRAKKPKPPTPATPAPAVTPATSMPATTSAPQSSPQFGVSGEDMNRPDVPSGYEPWTDAHTGAESCIGRLRKKPSAPPGPNPILEFLSGPIADVEIWNGPTHDKYIGNTEWFEYRFPETVEAILDIFSNEVDQAVWESAQGLGQPGFDGILIGPSEKSDFHWSDFGDWDESVANSSIWGVGHVTFQVTTSDYHIVSNPGGGGTYTWEAQVVVYDELGFSNRNKEKLRAIGKLVYPPRRVIRAFWTISGSGTFE